MNKKAWSIYYDRIEFDRDFIKQTINSFVKENYENITEEEKLLLIDSILNKIVTFEKTLFDKFNIYIHHDSKPDYNHINDVMFSMQLKIRYFISVCMQQEFRHLIL